MQNAVALIALQSIVMMDAPVSFSAQTENAYKIDSLLGTPSAAVRIVLRDGQYTDRGNIIPWPETTEDC